MMPTPGGPGAGAFNMPMPEIGGGGVYPPISGASGIPGYPPTSFLPNSGGYVSLKLSSRQRGNCNLYGVISLLLQKNSNYKNLISATNA